MPYVVASTSDSLLHFGRTYLQRSNHNITTHLQVLHEYYSLSGLSATSIWLWFPQDYTQFTPTIILLNTAKRKTHKNEINKSNRSISAAARVAFLVSSLSLRVPK